MQKSMQNKIIAICVVVGTLIISAIGLIYINSISNMKDVQEVVEVSKKYLIISVLIFIFLEIFSIVTLNRIVKKSMANIMKNAGKIVIGSNTNVKLLQDGTKAKDEFLSAFDDATLEIREHLKDVDNCETIKEGWEVAYKQFVETLSKIGLVEIETSPIKGDIVTCRRARLM